MFDRTGSSPPTLVSVIHCLFGFCRMADTLTYTEDNYGFKMWVFQAYASQSTHFDAESKK
jgi:hypothetical protein